MRAGEHADWRARQRVQVTRCVSQIKRAGVDVDRPGDASDSVNRQVALAALGEAEATVIERRRINSGAPKAFIEFQRTGSRNGDR